MLQPASPCRRFCRTPRGVRGLKCATSGFIKPVMESHPARGARIEMEGDERFYTLHPRRTPRGVRGLKCQDVFMLYPELKVAPREGCAD